MGPRLRKFALSVHLTCSVGWIGAVLAYLALGGRAAISHDAQAIRSSWTAMELIGWYVIVPLALTSLSTGLVMALGTKWGLLRHYWVLISLGLTVSATAVLLLHMPTVSATAELVQRMDGDGLKELGGDLLHPGIGLIVLVVVQTLNLYKPPGMTPYGWRKQQRESAAR